MSKRVLIGLDEEINNLSNLKSYSEILKNISPVKFVGVFINDFVRESVTHATNADAEFSKETTKRFANNVELDVFAEKNNIEYSLFRDNSNNERILITKSSFADLFLVDSYFTQHFFSGEHDVVFNLIEQMQCPVFIHPIEIDRIKDIFILFDGKSSSIHAIKNFVTLFKSELKEKTITTVFSISPETEEEIEQEKYLINYLISNFENVGIQATDGYSLERDMLKLLGTSEYPLFILGESGFELICNTKILKELHSRHIPAFFAK